MKNTLVLTLLSIVFLVTTLFAIEPPKSPKITVSGKGMKVVFGQPSKREREIFGALVPYDQIWRAGANEATEITFNKNVKFAGADVKAGTYTLFATPTKDKWTIILNSKLGQWGAYDYDKIRSTDVAKIEAAVIPLSTVVEKLTYIFDGKGLGIAWDKTSVFVPIVSQ